MATLSFAQNCDCESNFEWVKKTFEENDAGFEYALKTKGTQAYEDHNNRILEKIKSANTIIECVPVLYEWLTFFRSGHISIKPTEQTIQMLRTSQANEPSETMLQFPDWETYSMGTEKFKSYLDNKTVYDYEGIWESKPYKIGIKKEDDKYIGFIIESGVETWTEGQVKLKFSTQENKTNSVFYMRDHSGVESENVSLIGENHLQIGDILLTRLYPQIDDNPKFTQYFRMLNADLPYTEHLNETTLYFRIPSFGGSEKQAIDSVIAADRDKILKSENLIIDIRDGSGGSDASYQELLPFMYTNPIRTVGAEFLSTKLNNQRMLDFINKPEYGFDEDTKIWFKASYEKLEKQPGEFVNLEENIVSITKYDTVYPYPKNIGIIINQQNGSTDEQFLLAAKQSKKVKLFGTTTYGTLDVSNMNFTTSPCNEFELGYCLSRSMRIPDFTIDGKGLQPDYYLDRSIPLYNWTEYVNDVLNE